LYPPLLLEEEEEEEEEEAPVELATACTTRATHVKVRMVCGGSGVGGEGDDDAAVAVPSRTPYWIGFRMMAQKKRKKRMVL
jgi:hypothetical protein